jgi:exodeoxyribonuclease VII large subunit
VLPAPRFFTLSDITARVSQILAPHLYKTFWVRGEISSSRQRGGAFYCDLIETDDTGTVCARMRCTIWSRDLARIHKRFDDAGIGLKLDDGTEVGLQCALQYDARHGLSLRGQDADPAFAIGELELRRRAILQRLAKDGLFEPNKRLLVPTLPLRIGVVTSRSSAACSDFLKTLIHSGFGYRILIADALMQGAETEGSVLRALDTLERLEPSLIVIIRGGGSRSDLAWLDNEAIARRTAACQIPVWSGIGHETDESVIDCVVNMSHKTPTAVACAILERFEETVHQLEAGRERLHTVWTHRLDTERRRFERDRTGIRQGTRKLMQLSRAELRQRRQAVKLQADRRLCLERQSHEALRQRCMRASRSLIRAWRDRLVVVNGRCQTMWRHRIEVQQSRLERDRTGITQGTRKMVDVARAELNGRARQFSGAARATLVGLYRDLRTRRSRFSLERATAQIDAKRSSLMLKGQALRIADPEASLRRGFALVYDHSGRVVGSVCDVSPGDSLRTRIGDGVISSNVTAVEVDEDGRGEARVHVREEDGETRRNLDAP